MADIITISDNTDIPAPPPGQSMGLIPRDFMRCPVGYLPVARPFDMPLLSDQEIEEGIKRQEEEKSSLQHVRERGDNGNPIPSLDQNGQGYCWAYSTTSGVMLSRVAAGLPYVRLSAHMVACIIKGYRDQGGYNAQSVEFAAEHGIASVATWPEKSMSRSNDTPAMRADAKQHQLIEFMDLDEGGENLKRQMATSLLNNIPYASDHSWWSHSILAVRLIAWKPTIKVRIWNSWRDDWSDKGMGDLEGSRAVPQGAISIRVVNPS